MRDQFIARRHVDPVHVGETHRRRSRRKVHTIGAGVTRHLNDFLRGRPAHDRVIDQQHILAPELHAHRIELLANTFLARRLPGHDKGPSDIAVFQKPFAVVNAQLHGELHGGRTRSLGDRHYHIDITQPQFGLDTTGEILAHLEPGRIHGSAINQRIRTGEIHVLENTRIQHGRWRAVPGMQAAIEIDENRLARSDIALQPKSQTFERGRFACHEIVGTRRCLHSPVAKRTDAKRIAKCQQAQTGDLDDTGIRATHPLVESGDGAKDRLRVWRDRLTRGL